MKRLAPVIALGLLVAVPCMAQIAGDLGGVRQQTSLTDSDRRRIRQFVEDAVQAMLADTKPDKAQTAAARQAILNEVQSQDLSTPEYRRVFAEVTIEVLTEAESRLVSQPVRVNYMMVLAGLGSVDAVPLLSQAVEKDPYQASRYWAAKGLAVLAPVIVDRVMPRAEASIAQTAKAVLAKEASTMVLLHLFDALGRFSHEQANDVLAQGATDVAQRADVSDPIGARLWSDLIRSLERTYEREVRPEAKTAVLTAYATMCTQINPPLNAEQVPESYNRVMVQLNASLEKILGESRGFSATEPLALQKLALLEWVEALVKTDRIPKRPPLPKAVEEAVREQTGAGTGEQEPPAPAPEAGGTGETGSGTEPTPAAAGT